MKNLSTGKVSLNRSNAVYLTVLVKLSFWDTYECSTSLSVLDLTGNSGKTVTAAHLCDTMH